MKSESVKLNQSPECNLSPLAYSHRFTLTVECLSVAPVEPVSLETIDFECYPGAKQSSELSITY